MTHPINLNNTGLTYPDADASDGGISRRPVSQG
jgi:hypothetical protein